MYTHFPIWAKEIGDSMRLVYIWIAITSDAFCVHALPTEPFEFNVFNFKTQCKQTLDLFSKATTIAIIRGSVFTVCLRESKYTTHIPNRKQL